MGMAPAVDWMGTFGNAFDMFITEFCIPNKSVTLIKEKMLLIYVLAEEITTSHCQFEIQIVHSEAQNFRLPVPNTSLS